MTEETGDSGSGLSRRSFITKGAIAGGAVLWATPVVDSFVTPVFGATQGSIQGCTCSAIITGLQESSCAPGGFSGGGPPQLLLEVQAQGFKCQGPCRTSGTQFIWDVDAATAVNTGADSDPQFTYPHYSTGDATHHGGTLYGVSLTGGAGSVSTFIVRINGTTFCNNGNLSCTPPGGPVCFQVSQDVNSCGGAAFPTTVISMVACPNF